MLIDPGDEVAALLAFAEREQAGDSPHPADARARRSRHRRRRRQARARRAGLPAPRRSVSLRARRRDGRDVRPARRAAAADRRVLRARRRRSRSASYEVARRITRRDIVPAASACRSARRATGGKDLFVGDTLFAGSIGRTDLPGGDYDDADRVDPQRAVSVRRRADVHPGHGPTRRSARSAGPTRFSSGRPDAGLKLSLSPSFEP